MQEFMAVVGFHNACLRPILCLLSKQYNFKDILVTTVLFKSKLPPSRETRFCICLCFMPNRRIGSQYTVFGVYSSCHTKQKPSLPFPLPMSKMRSPSSENVARSCLAVCRLLYSALKSRWLCTWTHVCPPFFSPLPSAPQQMNWQPQSWQGLKYKFMHQYNVNSFFNIQSNIDYMDSWGLGWIVQITENQDNWKYENKWAKNKTEWLRQWNVKFCLATMKMELFFLLLQ